MPESMTRRDFMKTSAALAALRPKAYGRRAAGAGLANSDATAPATESTATPEWRNRNPQMRYRRLGRTGFMISEIVCGGDPITPTNIHHVEVAIGMGLNYLDTSPVYNDGLSEEGYSKLIQGADRDRVFVNTKVDPFSANRYQAYLEVFKSLPATEQAEVLRAASDDMARRQATVPEYMGGYFTGQERQIEEMAIANVLEKKYGAKIDRPKRSLGLEKSGTNPAWCPSQRSTPVRRGTRKSTPLTSVTRRSRPRSRMDEGPFEERRGAPSPRYVS